MSGGVDYEEEQWERELAAQGDSTLGAHEEERDGGGDPLQEIGRAALLTMTENEIKAAMESEVEEQVVLTVKHSLTVPHREPLSNELVGKRQLKKLPCFSTLLHVHLPEPQGHVIISGKLDGAIVEWWLNGYTGLRSRGATNVKPGGKGGGFTPSGVTTTGTPNVNAATVTSTKQAQLQLRQEDALEKHLPFIVGMHKGNVTCLAYAPTPKLLLSGSSDCTIKLWDLMATDPSTARCTQTLNAHDSTITAIAVHCNLVLSGSIDKTLKVWRFEEGRDSMCFPWAAVRQVFIFDAWVTSLWASPFKIAETSQGEIFAGDANGGITVLRSNVSHDEQTDAVVATSVELLRHVPHVISEKKQAITRILPIPNLNLVISLSYESHATMTDLAGFNKLVEIPHPDKNSGRFLDVCWNGAHEEVLLLDVKGNIFIWDTKLNRMRSQQQMGLSATALAAIYTHAEDGSAASAAPVSTLWMAEREGVLGMTIERTSCMVEHKGHTGRIMAMTLPHRPADEPTRSGGPLSKLDDIADFFLATASVDNTICLWGQNMALLKKYTEKYSEISAFLALPLKSWLVTGHENGSLKFWSLVKDRTFRFMAHENTVSGIYEGFHRHNRGRFEEWHHLFSVSYDGFLAVWELPLEGSKAKCEGRVRVSNSELICAAYDEIKKCYIVGGNSGDITIWSVEELRQLHGLSQPIPASMRSSSKMHHLANRPAHTEAVTCLALDGNTIFSGGEDARLFLWNYIGEKQDATLLKSLLYLTDSGSDAEVGEIQQFIVHPSTGDLIACTRSGQIILFSQETGVATAVYSMSREVSSIAFSRASEEVVAGMEDGIILRIHLNRFRPIIATDLAVAAAREQQQAILHPDRRGSDGGGDSGAAVAIFQGLGIKSDRHAAFDVPEELDGSAAP